jgi:hypothetical protein
MTEPIVGRGGQKVLALFCAGLLVGASLYASRDGSTTPAAAGQKADPPAAPTNNAVATAEAFLAALDADKREKATYAFGSPKKPSWSNLPVTFVPRNGVRLGDLSKEQREKAMAVVAAVLSKDGYRKVLDIMDGDQLLAEGKGGGKDKGKDKKGGKGGGPQFGVDNYYLALFGKPSATEAWMVQFGGHHLGVNVTVIGKHFILTPTHTGTQPAKFTKGDREVRPLGAEVDAGFELIAALDEKQRAQAIIGDKPQGELLYGPGRDARAIGPPQGIKGSALTARQRGMLLEVIDAWVNIAEPDAARARLTAIWEKIGETYFAWSGPTAKGSAAYFRVQGPAVVIEYAPQGGTDHIHTVIRNPEDDYGAGTLKK